jgi:hypothetical protein
MWVFVFQMMTRHNMTLSCCIWRGGTFQYQTFGRDRSAPFLFVVRWTTCVHSERRILKQRCRAVRRRGNRGIAGSEGTLTSMQYSHLLGEGLAEAVAPSNTRTHADTHTHTNTTLTHTNTTLISSLNYALVIWNCIIPPASLIQLLQ